VAIAAGAVKPAATVAVAQVRSAAQAAAAAARISIDVARPRNANAFRPSAISQAVWPGSGQKARGLRPDGHVRGIRPASPY
jgi:hypothetical protein